MLDSEMTLSTPEDNKIFDIVFPVGPDESDIIENVVSHARDHIKNFDKIYLITADKDVQVKDCITIHESIFPFSKKDVERLLPKHPKPGWVFQQLLKLYCLKCIAGLKDDILVIDADVYVLNDLQFFDNKFPIFTIGYEFTKEYHQHAEKLHPSLKRFNQKWSGISHHMLFNRQKIDHLFQIIENKHNKPFFDVFFENLDLMCSEYEIYFNFLCNYYIDEIKIRELRWANVPHYESDMVKKYDYISHAKWFGTR